MIPSVVCNPLSPCIQFSLSLFSHSSIWSSQILVTMSSLFLLYLLFYCRKFSSARCNALISLCKSLTRCRAAFSLLSLRFRDGFWWYLLFLRSLSVPSFIMRFLRRVIALSGLSWRFSFTVSMWSILYECYCICSCLAATRSLFSLHEYCTTTCWVCQVACCATQSDPQKFPAEPCCGVPLPVALWYVWGGVWVVVSWAAVD